MAAVKTEEYLLLNKSLCAMRQRKGASAWNQRGLEKTMESNNQPVFLHKKILTLGCKDRAYQNEVVSQNKKARPVYRSVNFHLENNQAPEFFWTDKRKASNGYGWKKLGIDTTAWHFRFLFLLQFHFNLFLSVCPLFPRKKISMHIQKSSFADRVHFPNFLYP